ncbi:hypothetical protein [Micromonospora sp. SL4-19]
MDGDLRDASYEALPDNFASMIRIAMIDNLTKRVTDETTPTWRDI